jgi:hypothetical protein
MQDLFFDLRFLVRQLRKSPGFAVTAVSILVFGIGGQLPSSRSSRASGCGLCRSRVPTRLAVLADRLEGAATHVVLNP